MKKFFSIAVMIFTLATMVGCGKGTEENVKDKKNVKVGCMRITEDIIDIIIEEMGDSEYKIEKVVFDGTSNIPATALNDGSIDGFLVNHLQWVEVFNKENNANLKMVEPYIYYFKNGVYSSKYDSYKDLPEKAVVAIPGDPNNMDRSLRLLQRMGLIKLNEDKELCNVADITENPKNIQLLETEITATVKSLYDVDMIISGANAMRLSGEDFENSLFDDPIDKEFPISLTVNDGTEDAGWVKAFMEVTERESFKEKFNNVYKGTFVLYKDAKEK